VVTLLNRSDGRGFGWQRPTNKATMPPRELAPGSTVQVVVQAPMTLSNKGGILTLLDDQGRKIHGVYTQQQARDVWTICF
jgi:hypothetical protein